MDRIIKKYLGNEIPVEERLFYLTTFTSTIAALGFVSIAVFVGVEAFSTILWSLVILVGVLSILLERRFHKTTLFSVLFIVIINLIILPLIFHRGSNLTVEVPLYSLIGIAYALILLKGVARIILVSVQVIVDVAMAYYCFVMKNSGLQAYGATSAEEYIRIEIAVIIAGILCGVIVRYRNILLEQEICMREKAIAQAEQVSFAKDMFLVNVSHEIRTPLNAIIGTTEMLLDSDTNNHVKEMAFNISNSSHALLSITTDLLDFSRMNVDSLAPVKETYDISLMLNDIINLMSVRLLDSNVDFYVKIDPKLPKYMNGDSGKIRQIIINLLSNAIKYTKEGHMTFSVDFKTNGGTASLRIKVEDTGIGIKEESIEKIFEPYNRSGEITDHMIEGNGLGLALCKKLAGAMGGMIWAESVYGEGSTFYFDVNQEIAGTETIGELVNKKLRVAVYSDNPQDSLDFYDICNQMKLSCVRHSDEEDFLVCACDKSFDYFFMDSIAYDRLKQKLVDRIDWKKLVIISGCNYSYSGEPFEFVLTKPISCLNVSDIVNGAKSFAIRRQIYEGKFEIPDATILVVDDNIVNLSVAAGLLERYKAKVLTAASGKEALNIIEVNMPDIIFLDYMMPDMDGIDTLKAIRALDDERCKTVPIIVLTANVVSGAREMFINAGFDDYLSKPIETDKLEKTISEKIDKEFVRYLI